MPRRRKNHARRSRPGRSHRGKATMPAGREFLIALPISGGAPERFGCCLDRLLIVRRTGAAHADGGYELRQHGFRQVGRVLRRSTRRRPWMNQPRPAQSSARFRLGVFEEQVCLVEETRAWVFRSPTSAAVRRAREKPEQEGAVHLRRLNQFVGRGMLYTPRPLVGLQEIASTSSIGSPKNLSPPCCSTRRARAE